MSLHDEGKKATKNEEIFCNLIKILSNLIHSILAFSLKWNYHGPFAFQVRIYVDAVINHMCGEGVGSGTSSTCGSYFNSQNREFSGVPYSAWDFNDGKCKTASGGIESYNDAAQVIIFNIVIH